MLGVTFQQLTSSPFDGQEMHAGRCLSNLDGLHDIRVLNALAVSRFTNKASDRRLVLTQFLAQDLHRDNAMLGMLGTKDGGGSALPDFPAQRISRQAPTDQVLFGHEANLTSLRALQQAARWQHMPEPTPEVPVRHVGRVSSRGIFLTKDQSVPI